jgi:uncharacterized membrane protein
MGALRHQEVQPATQVDSIHRAQRSLMRIGVVLGIGVVGTLDEAMLHQLLQWHSFYVHTTTYWRIVSDGIFHLITSGLLLTGALLLWARRRQLRTRDEGLALAAGMLFGMGGFNLYDGIIQHNILHFRDQLDSDEPPELCRSCAVYNGTF